MTGKNQEHLIEKCIQNDSRAQMQLYDLYCKAMFNTAYNFIKDDAIAQDVMQEAFIKAGNNDGDDDQFGRRMITATIKPRNILR